MYSRNETKRNNFLRLSNIHELLEWIYLTQLNTCLPYTWHVFSHLSPLFSKSIFQGSSLQCASSDATCFLTPHFMLMVTKLTNWWWPDDTSTSKLEKHHHTSLIHVLLCSFSHTRRDIIPFLFFCVKTQALIKSYTSVARVFWCDVLPHTSHKQH